MGFFDPGDSPFCEKCLFRCFACLKAKECLSCAENSFRTDVARNCSCIDGYFERIGNPVCLKCAPQC
jgi:hypothetical protein